MKIILSIIFALSCISVFGADYDKGISFVNATNSDNLIVLCRIISHLDGDLTKGIFPTRMAIEVIDVLKGRDSAKSIIVEGYRDDPSHFNLGYLQFYTIGGYYILGLENYKLIAAGHHFLEFKNNTVIGNVTNEPSKEYSKKNKKLFEKLQKEELSKNRNAYKIESLRSEFKSHCELLDQTMDYIKFKETLRLSLANQLQQSIGESKIN